MRLDNNDALKRWLWVAWRLGGSDRVPLEHSYFDMPCIPEAQARQRMCNEVLSVGRVAADLGGGHINRRVPTRGGT